MPESPPAKPPPADEHRQAAAGDSPPLQLHAIPALLVFILLFLTVALQFFTRYVLNDSFGWTEEIARYFLILLGFTGSIICARNSSHIALEFFYRYLPAAAARWCAVFARLTCAGFFLYCGWLAVELAQQTNSSMASIQLSKSVIYYIVAVSCLAAGAVTIASLRRR